MAYVLCDHCPETEVEGQIVLEPRLCKVCRGTGLQDAAEAEEAAARYAWMALEYDAENRALLASLPF